LNWEPKIALVEGLRLSLDYFRKELLRSPKSLTKPVLSADLNLCGGYYSCRMLAPAARNS